MELEGRVFSSLYKNTTEELFLNTVTESPIGMPLSTTEMLGFKAASQSFRTDIEELFKRWLTHEEEYNSASKGLNSRLSQRMSLELTNLWNQQNAGVVSEGRSSDKLCMQYNPLASDGSADFNQLPMRDPVDRELQSSNMFLAKAWFLSDQRMTRSRSSELRRRYAEIQNAQATQGMESISMVAPQHGVDTMKQEVSNLNGFNYLSVYELQHQKGAFISPSSSTFNTHQLCDADKVSSCVSMLKGTLECKRLGNQVEKESLEHSSNGLSSPQDALFKTGFTEGLENWSHEKPIIVHGTSTGQVKDNEVLQTLEGSINLGSASREPSQSESSAAVPVVSSGLDACEDPSNSSQTLCESSWKEVGISRSSENRVKGFREQIMDNLKDDSKRSLERYGSVASAISEDKRDATKKRRVERFRKYVTQN